MDKSNREEARFEQKIKAEEARKVKVNARGKGSVWLGLGVIGLIGWSVAIPTLIGVAGGIWLDHRLHGGRSWTLTLLVAGLGLGCLIAWRWVAKEEEAIRKEEEQ